jgi:hypothetical protein
MVKAKDMTDSLDGKFSLAEAKEDAERGKKTSIKIVRLFKILFSWCYEPRISWQLFRS